MEIPDYSLAKFGNMTTAVGGTTGLDNLADDSGSTFGYIAATKGYYGICLGAASAIEKVDLRSTSHGFDSSGSAGPNTIELRAANTQPSGSNFETHGTLLGTITFTETPATVVTRTVQSSDTTTQYLYVWVVVKTAVYAEAADVMFYRPDPPPPAAIEIGAGGETITISCNDKQALSQAGNEVFQFRIRIKLTETRVVGVKLHVGIAHLGLASEAAIGLGVSFIRRFGATESDLDAAPILWSENDVITGQIRDLRDHYNHPCGFADWELAAGYHEIGVFISAHTSMSALNHQAEIKAEGPGPFFGRNKMAVEVKPVGHILHTL